MRIIKFNESTKDELEELFLIAEREYDHIKDICTEIEDDVGLTIGYSYIPFNPQSSVFEKSEWLITDLRGIIEEFPSRIKDRIVFGEINISYQIGIGFLETPRNEVRVYDINEFGDEDNGDIYTYLNNTSIDLSIKILTFVKQFNKRIDRKYHILHHLDETGVMILIGRKISK